jgi:hypothetical protein
MDFRNCAVCGKMNMAWDMIRDQSGLLICPVGECALPMIEKIAKDLQNDPAAIEGIKKFAEANGGTFSAKITIDDELRQVQPHPLQEEFGFQQPEDGSEERYKKRQLDVPWAKHQFWWFVHNNIAHPLIGVLPIRVFFRFHDYTSRRMHGVSRER